MPKEPSNFFVDYIELGKIYTASDATDFQILDYSSPEILSSAGERCRHFVKGLKYPDPPDKTPFSKIATGLSCCFIRVRDTRITASEVYYYLFVQIQRREEGDYAKKLGNTPRINRSFNHIRFVHLGDDDRNNLSINLLESYLIKGYRIFSGLLHKNKNGTQNIGNDIHALNDYYSDAIIPKSNNLFNPQQLSKISFSNNEDNVKGIVNLITDKLKKSNKCSVQIIDPGYSWIDKLKLLESAFVLLWPISGLLTFSLEYISDRSDIAVQFFHLPNLDGKFDREKISDYIQNYPSFDELLLLRNKHLDNFEDVDFIEKMRILFSFGASILNSADMASVLCGFSDDELKNILENTTNVKALVLSQLFTDYLKIFRKKVSTQEYLDKVYDILSKDSSVFSNKLLHNLLEELFSEHVSDDKLPLFTPLIVKYDLNWQNETILLRKLVSFIDTFSRLAKISRNISHSLKNKIYSLLIEKNSSKIVNPRNHSDFLDTIACLNLYLELEPSVRKNYIQIINEILNARPELFTELKKKNLELSITIYREIINFLLLNNIFFTSWLLQKWIPGNDIELDNLIKESITSRQVSLEEFINYAVLSKGVEKLKWLLKEFKNEKITRKAAETVIYISREPEFSMADDYIAKFELCMTNLVSIDRLDENYNLAASLNRKFAYAVFPVSNYTQIWFFNIILTSSEDEIISIMEDLRSHARVLDGLSINPKLTPFLSKTLDFSNLLNRYLKNELPQNLFFALLDMHADQDYGNLVEILLDKFHKFPSCNKILAELARRSLRGKIEFQSVQKWLLLTRSNNLRSDYLDGTKDYLRAYISGLPNCNDDWLYEAYILDVLLTNSEIYWQEYIKQLPKNKSKNSKYARCLEVIFSLESSLIPKTSTRDLLRQVIEISELIYENRDDRERKARDLQYYLQSEKVLMPIYKYVNGIIQSQKKEYTRWSLTNTVGKPLSLGADEEKSDRVDRKRFSRKDSITPILIGIVMCLILIAIPSLYKLWAANMADPILLIAMILLSLLGIGGIFVIGWYILG